MLSVINPSILSYERTNASNLTKINSFDIELTNGTTVSLKDFTNKPIVLNWGASWCPICKANMKTMNNILDSAIPYFNFITLSYGGSKDTLNDIIGLKNIGPYNWTFGFDVNDVASNFKITNGYLWVLNTNLEIVQAWNYTIVPQDQLVNAMSTLHPITVDSANKSLFFLFNNPLFLLFGGFIILAVIAIVVIRFYPRSK